MMRPLLLLLLALPLLGAEKICGVFEWEQNRNESAEIERCEAAFKHLLGEKSESDMEKDISNYFSKFGINLNFR